MQVDYSPRQMGKTTRMIEWLRKDTKRVLITFSHDEENRLKRLYPDLSNRILDWESYLSRYTRGMDIDQVVAIDNADIILQRMVDRPIEIITVSDLGHTNSKT